MMGSHRSYTMCVCAGVCVCGGGVQMLGRWTTHIVTPWRLWVADGTALA